MEVEMTFSRACFSSVLKTLSGTDLSLQYKHDPSLVKYSGYWSSPITDLSSHLQMCIEGD